MPADNFTSTNHPQHQPEARKPRRSLIVKLLRALGFTILGLIIVVLVVISAAVWFLTPERLGPIISHVASEQLDADVNVGRAELTFWKSFPKIKIAIDDLEIVSRSLNSLPDSVKASLPADADSLLSLKRFEGAIDVSKLATGRIAIKDVLLDGPRINLLQVNDSVANFNILPTNPDDTTKATIPDITINRFAIVNARPITYRSLSAPMFIEVDLHTISLTDRGLPQYEITVNTDFDTPLLQAYNLTRATLSLDGRINWDGRNPYQLSISDLIVKMMGIDVTVNTSIDFHDSLIIKSLDVDVNSIDVNALKQHAPAELREKLAPLSTSMVARVKMRLDEPLEFNDSLAIPSATMWLNVPPCYIDFNDLHFKSFETALTASVKSSGLNSARVDIDHIKIDGRAVDLDLSGNITRLFSSPVIDATVKGGIDFSHVPPTLQNLIPGLLTGQLTLDTRIKGSADQFNPKQFHKLYADGTIDLTNMRYLSNDTLIKAYARNTRVTFGSTRSVRARESNSRIDSMLVVTIDTDTISAIAGMHHIAASKFHAGFASQNRAASADTTTITPFGGAIDLGRLRYESKGDSVRVSLRGAHGVASLQQFQDAARVPFIKLNMALDRFGVTTPEMRASITDASLRVNTHLRQRRDRNKPLSAADSLARQQRRAARSHLLTQAQLDSIGVETIDIKINQSLRDVILRWNAEGSMHAQRGSIRTPRFPLRTRLSNLDMTFTTDSIALNSLHVKSGRTSCDIVGSVANLRGALNRRRPQAPRIHFNVDADTIHINQIVQAIAAGHRKNMLDDPADNDLTAEEREVEHLEREMHLDTILPTLLIPVNITADLNLKANHVVYSDMMLDNIGGQVLVDRGAVQIKDLHAANEAGALRISALYNAPVAERISMGLGMVFSNINIDGLKRFAPRIMELLPMFGSFSGIINAKLAATVDIDPQMNLKMSTLRAALNFNGDSLAVKDNAAMRKAAKWLMFKNKTITSIDSIDVNLVVRDNVVTLYPFIVNVDRYRLGIMGHSDMDQNLDYHVAVLKSPIPFKFGINIKGDIDHPKIRLGGSRFNEKTGFVKNAPADTLRINLIDQMNSFFRHSVREARLGPLDIKRDSMPAIEKIPESVITHTDSVLLIDAGLIEAPDSVGQLQNVKK